MSKPQILFLAISVVAGCGGLRAQENLPTAGAPEPKLAAESGTPAHKFWDAENIALFAGVGGARMMDYASTRHLRDEGNDEWLLTDRIVDNRPLFVGIELAGTAASIGVSYLFHRSGHHTLERWTSLIHIGVGVGGSVRNYLLKPPTVVVTPTTGFQTSLTFLR